MEKSELLKRLQELKGLGDPEVAHEQANVALLEYIGDQDIRRAFEAIRKWYA